MKNISVRTVAKLGLLLALALALGYFESLLPVSGIPGIKLGLSNTVLLYALYLVDRRSAWVLMVLKVVLSGLLFGGVNAMIYSFAGGVLSLTAMILMKKIKSLSIIGVSISGAVMHNVGQVLAACFMVSSAAVLSWLPVLLVSSVVTGTVTGVIAKYAFKWLEKSN